MGSLKLIMDMDDEEPILNNKRDATSSTPGTSRVRDLSASSDHATNPGDHHDRLITTAATTKRRGASGRHSTSSAAATSSSSSTSTARPAPPARGSSSASNEDMDRGYGGHSSGSASGGMNPSNTPMRPMGNPSGGDIPIKLTPITGRVSRAKKGVPVHTCEICRPPKTFTRAEHLRRHQLSHQTPGHPCTYPGCDRSFHRADLLARHATRHEQEGDRLSSKGTDDTSRRTSTTSMDEGSSRMAYMHGSSTLGGGSSSRGSRSTPSSDMPSNTNYPGNTASYQSIGNQGGGGATPMSPPQQLPHRRDSYRSSSSGPSQAPGGGYILSSASIPTITNQPPSVNSSPTTAMGYGIDQFQSPRTSSPFPLCLVTQGLQQTYPSLSDPDSNPPGLLPHHEASPAWASSDSSFSTPSDIGNKRNVFRSSYESPTSDWPFVSAYQATTSQDLREPGGGLDAITSGPPFFTNPFSPSPHHPSFPHMMDMPMTFQDDSGFLSGHAHHHPYSSVRSPTPPNISSSVQSAESLVTLAPSLPDTQAVAGRYKDSVALLGPGVTFPSAVTLPRSVRNAIPDFLEVYWTRFDTLFPLVHRRSFEIAPGDVLRCAMAAVATQFLDGKEDRVKGNQLHEYAWQEVRRAPQWNVQIMQAILLCEFFARFRGRKAVIRPSPPFQSLYSRVANPQVPDHTFGSTTNGVSTTTTTNATPVARWTEWIDAEARRRLLAACFVLDVHTSVYYEQPLMQHFTNPCPPIPLTAVSQDLWEAPTPEVWEAHLSSGPRTSEPLILSEDIATPERIAAAPPLDQAVFLASEALRLPKRTGPSTLDLNIAPDLSAAGRITNIFQGAPVANTYLALHYTPLQDLLAVSGDSWLFTQKILPSQSFQQHQKRLKQWTGSLHAAIAAKFAAKALVAFLNDNSNTTTTPAYREDMSTAGERRGWNMSDISDYWAVYVCALICWALSHQATRGGGGNGATGGGNAGVVSNINGNTAEERESEAEALGWLHLVAGLEPADVLSNVNVRGRRDIMGVVAMVKRRLEGEAAGAKSRLLVDALGVLRKLEEGVNWKWF